jgi:hypothetical protein
MEDSSDRNRSFFRRARQKEDAPEITEDAAPESAEDTAVAEADGAAEEDTSDARTSRRHDALLPVTVVGGLLGMLAGTLPATVWYLIFGRSFSFMYLFLPLLVYLGIRLLRGYGGRRGIVAASIFTAFGFYLTLLSCRAAAFVLYWKGMSFVNVPFVTITMIGQRGVLQGSAVSTAYILPFVFTLIGMFLAGELLLAKRAPSPAPEPAPEDETA